MTNTETNIKELNGRTNKNTKLYLRNGSRVTYISIQDDL